MKRGIITEKDMWFMGRDIKFIEKNLGLVEKKIWRLIFHFKYPKIALLAILTLVSYIIFRSPNVQGFVSSLGALEYLGVFIAGILFTFGFTTPFAVGFFIILNPANPFLVAVIGGVGSLLGDLLIFSVIRFSFIDEFKRLKKTRVMKRIRSEIKLHLSYKARLYLLSAFAGLIIASPLPDEAGVTLLAGLTNIKLRTIAIISFVGNTLGILIMCLI
jgi:uncharacterized membrane protein YdjX (TVP38/TMEM64 family)